jgi:pimeloyl-ACP methyl ester carboxylesterase
MTLKISNPDQNLKNIDISDWQTFKKAQKSLTLPAGSATHIDVNIRYIDMGENELGCVLLMHGIPTWGFLYHQTIPELVAAGYRVIAPDFLGHGWSDRRDRFDRSFQDQARMITSLLDALNISTIHVVGHDTGGAVALILAIEHKRYVDRLVISNSVCYDSFDDDMLDFGHPMRWKTRPLEDLIEALEESLSAGISDNKQLTSSFREGIIAPWASEEGKLSLLRNASALNANQTMALVDRHATISSPTLLIWGEDDPWQKIEDGQQLASEIPGALFHAVVGASHWVQQDAPEEFSFTLLNFLNKDSVE